EPIATWQDLRWQILQAALQRQAVSVETLSERGHMATVTIDLRDFPSNEVESDVLERIGLRLYRPMLAPVIGKVVPGGSAERSGLQAGDRVVSADGKPIRTWDDFVGVVRSKPGTPIPLVVERGATTLSVEVTADPKTRIIGAQVRQSEDYVAKMFVRVQHGPLTAVAKGA